MVCSAIPVVLGRGAIFNTCRFGLAVKEREGHAREGANAGTNSLRTLGVAAMLVISLCLTYIDEFQPARGKSSFDLINNAHLSDCQMIETEKGDPRFRGTVGKKREIAPAFLPQTTSPVETGSAAIYGDSSKSDRGQVEALHG